MDPEVYEMLRSRIEAHGFDLELLNRPQLPLS